MKRKALLIGLDYRDPQWALQGIPLLDGSNDVESWWRILHRYGFTAADIEICGDNKDATFPATKTGVLDRFAYMCAGTAPGDTLVCVISAHTCVVRDGMQPSGTGRECAGFCVNDGLVFFAELWGAAAALVPGSALLLVVDAPCGAYSMELGVRYPHVVTEPHHGFVPPAPKARTRYLPNRLPPPGISVSVLQQIRCTIQPGANVFVLCANDGSMPVNERQSADGTGLIGALTFAVEQASEKRAGKTHTVKDIFDDVEQSLLPHQQPVLLSTPYCLPESTSFILPAKFHAAGGAEEVSAPWAKGTGHPQWLTGSAPRPDQKPDYFLGFLI
jgi:hypothetical protein